MRKKLRLFIIIVFWRILRKSRIFNYWYKKFLNELLFDLEMFNIEGEEIEKKYRYKLHSLCHKEKK